MSLFKNKNTSNEEVIEPGYIWVKGFKGTDKNCQCRDNFQYEIGKSYVCEGEPTICGNGFHFCLNLENVFNYYTILDSNNRFFEVEALVKKEDFDKYGLYLPGTWLTIAAGATPNNKLAAKEIKLIRELSIEELYEVYPSIYKQIISLSDFQEFKEKEEGSHFAFVLNKAVHILTDKYSKTFITLLFKNISVDTEIINKTLKALALYDEGVSSDMRAYLLLM